MLRRIAKIIYQKSLIDSYDYNVQIWVSANGGVSYSYCGLGRFCKTIEEAREYARSMATEEVREFYPIRL